ncbi:MAG: hypothetical protein ABI643_00750 [Candidatus Doudnabacteria bacterium]
MLRKKSIPPDASANCVDRINLKQRGEALDKLRKKISAELPDRKDLKNDPDIQTIARAISDLWVSLHRDPDEDPNKVRARELVREFLRIYPRDRMRGLLKSAELTSFSDD